MAANEILQEPALDTLHLHRIFNAPRELVWQAWTTPALLMRWHGPKDFTAPVCHVDLRKGGITHLCMRSPEGQDFWSKGTYREIDAPHRMVVTDSFSDEQGNIISAANLGMGHDWPLELLVTLTFEEKDGKTHFHLQHEGLPTGEMLDLCRAGWIESLDKLENLLQQLQ
ncbi:SRPBCC family protein [Rufibacter quisquiliarum]|uniref:Uncharacterized protein YndB with AHSA1/START domain n=1 Tax=Rufibacter quisquiliarum TaxID=1549639 RepID=A0A839GKQ5_9BACT|nr:SRPBCC domain-containing protein [Rufibacter quisquiliarum]MBA9079432.1 uncharacterized protein YndB with AHSA1/START domain [Rufibacter quisquiliarum]